MIGLLLSVLASATAAPPAAPTNLVQDARHAIAVGRLKEARLVISRAVASGASGPIVERLLADLAFQSGKFDEAASRFQHLAASNQRDAHVCEAGGLAALHLGRWDAAKSLVECATAFPQSSWRAWNARGVIADHEADWALVAPATSSGGRVTLTQTLTSGDGTPINFIGFSSVTVRNLQFSTLVPIPFPLVKVPCPWSGT